MFLYGGLLGQVTRCAILLSPYFPPSTLAGVHRARLLAKHLPAAGWDPIVLCVDEAYYEQRLDYALAALVPERVRTVRVGALPARFTRPFGVGEISLRAWGPLRRALFQLLKTQRVSAVLITGAPFSMLLTTEIKRRFGIPVVLDFQDPWVSAWGAAQPTLSKAGLSHALARLLEPRVLRSADFVTAVSDTQNSELFARYPWLDRSRMAGIPIGGDPDDFTACHSVPRDGHLLPGFINLSYVGTFWPAAESSFRLLFQAFAQLRVQEPALAARIRLNFVGTSGQPDGSAKYVVRHIAEAEGITDAVREIPQRLPYLQALSILIRSHGLLLIGSAEPHYTASKIYPALMSGRPFLSLFHSASSAHTLLSAAGGGRSLGFGSVEELAGLKPSLVEGIKALAAAPASFGLPDSAKYALFEARPIAERFAEIFDRLAFERASRLG